MVDPGTLAGQLGPLCGLLLVEADEVVGDGRVHDEVLRTGGWDGPRGGAPGGGGRPGGRRSVTQEHQITRGIPGSRGFPSRGTVLEQSAQTSSADCT